MAQATGLGASAQPAEGVGAMFRKVAFTMYPVQDAERARAFYENTLGLVRGSASQDGVWTEYDLPGGGCLALFSGGSGVPSAEAGGCVALEVTDLDALIVRLKGEGVQFRAEGIDTPVCRMAVMLDSEGNAIVLHELKRRE
jgi:predicted enzyme related to lactoylglutathione lyase